MVSSAIQGHAAATHKALKDSLCLPACALRTSSEIHPHHPRLQERSVQDRNLLAVTPRMVPLPVPAAGKQFKIGLPDAWLRATVLQLLSE